MPSGSAPAELLADLSAALASLNAPWYVFGAQAVLIWGRPRLTTDVDATVKLDRVESAEMLRTLDANGFVLRGEGDAAFVRLTRVFPLQHTPSGLALDLVLAGPGLEDLFLDRVVHVDVAGVAIPFISPEDLIVTKVLAGREKDIEDIRGILAERGGTLGLDQIRGTLELVEDALGQSDLRPLFDTEVSRWRARSR